jgi:hypothetical protein
VSGASVGTSVTLDDGEHRHTTNISLLLTGTPAYSLEQPAITEALDEHEQDIRISPQTAEEPSEHARRRLENALTNASHRDERAQEAFTAGADLTRCPATFQRLSGSISAVVATRVVREKIKLEEMPEAVELAPGVTFLLSQVRRQEGSVTISYEVRVRRGRPDVTPGLEPVFAGLVCRDPAGQLLTTFHYGHPVDTRDEYIYVVKNAGVANSYLERGGTLEACVYDGLQRVTFNFGLTNLNVITPDERPTK